HSRTPGHIDDPAPFDLVFPCPPLNLSGGACRRERRAEECMYHSGDIVTLAAGHYRLREQLAGSA
ncbi:MAG TPA: hypothetical protein DDX04_13400, partial [Massilia sp.]|nr:hypothetical protein [Massilia sp.]